MAKRQLQQIARINELSVLARTSWLVLLAYLSYTGITLLSVEDPDFFVPSRQTELPLVGVAIPTFSFFVFAPPLGAALYIYFHIYLLKLFDALATAPASIDGEELANHIHPWLANDLFLTMRADNSASSRPLRVLSNSASFLLIWVAAPLVLAGFWWRSMPAHEEWLTIFLALSWLVAIYAGLSSWWAALSAAKRVFRRPWSKPWPEWWRWFFGLGAAIIIGLSGLRTEWNVDRYANRVVNFIEETLNKQFFEDGIWSDGSRKDASIVQAEWIASRVELAKIDLSGVEMVPLPESWRPYEAARSAFRERWCQLEGLSMAVCDHPPSSKRAAPITLVAEREKWCAQLAAEACMDRFEDLNERFREDWNTERSLMLASLTKLDLIGRDLRGAYAEGVSLVNADLSRVRLERAELELAHLEGANLNEAHLAGAKLTQSHLEGANLRAADLEGADLSEASLTGANLSEAHLERADLSAANLPGTNLSMANLPGANLIGANLEGANLKEANLEGADLTVANLTRASLKEAHLKGAKLWEAHLKGADLRWAHLEGANLSGAHLEGAKLNEAHFETADLMAAHLEGALLMGAHMERVILVEAHLEGANLIAVDLEDSVLEMADLRGAKLEEANLREALLWRANLEGADLKEVNLEGADLKEANLVGANLTEADLEEANLRKAHLEGANLREANLKGADLENARLKWALLHSADLRGVKNLLQAQLEKAIGNAQTLLPDGLAPDTGEPYYIWGCSEDLPRKSEKFLPWRSYNPRKIWWVSHCGNQSRERSGTPMNRSAAYPKEHPLAKSEQYFF